MGTLALLAETPACVRYGETRAAHMKLIRPEYLPRLWDSILGHT